MNNPGLEKIVNELGSRLSTDQFLRSNLIKLLSHCSKLGVSTKTLTENVQTLLNSESTNLIRNYQAVEYLFRHKVDITSLVGMLALHRPNPSHRKCQRHDLEKPATPAVSEHQDLQQLNREGRTASEVQRHRSPS